MSGKQSVTKAVWNVKDFIPNDKNPRYITEQKFDSLVDSIQNFSKMLEARPIVIDEDGLILGGNMRFKAAEKAGLKDIPVMVTKGWTVQEKEEFMIKDNLNSGSWDWDLLGNEWNATHLQEWGMDTWNADKAFEPIVEPMTNYSEVTEEAIERRANELVAAIISAREKIECICPECGYEFLFQGPRVPSS